MSDTWGYKKWDPKGHKQQSIILPIHQAIGTLVEILRENKREIFDPATNKILLTKVFELRFLTQKEFLPSFGVMRLATKEWEKADFIGTYPESCA